MLYQIDCGNIIQIRKQGNIAGLRHEKIPETEQFRKNRYLVVKVFFQQGRQNMVTAIILVKVKRDLIMEVIEELLKIEGIMEVHSIAGEYDLAVIARVGDNQELSLILADKMCHQMKGITHTKTLISLGAHYNFDEKKVFKKSKNK